MPPTGPPKFSAYLVERIRRRWPKVKIIVRADSGFARGGFMAWCESHDVYYLLGLARNERLLKKIGSELVKARDLYDKTGRSSRLFTQF